MRVLITGAQGWLGRAVVAAALAEPDTRVVGLGRSPASDRYTHRLGPGPGDPWAPLPRDLPRPDPARYAYQAVDLLDAAGLDALLWAARPAVVLHAAGLCHHGAPADLTRQNPEATAALLRALARLPHPRPRLLLVSSGAVYGGGGDQPLREGDPTAPATDYARSKDAAEQVAARLAQASGVPLRIARVFNLVGPGQPTTYLAGSLSYQLAAITLGLQPPRVHMGALRTTRDYLDVADAGQALWAVARAPEAEAITNVGSGRETPISAIWEGLRAAALAAGAPPLQIQVRPSPPGDVARQVADVRRLRALGGRPPRPLEASLAALFQWSLAALREGEV